LPSPQGTSSSSHDPYRLTVGLLEARTGALSAELLGLAATVVGDEEGAVVLGQGLLERVLAVLVDVLLVVGDQGLGDGLADGVDLRGVATSADADADVDLGELVDADDEEGLVDLFVSVNVAFRRSYKIETDLEAENRGLNEVEGLAVDLDCSLR